ncbi:MAG: hypothetical protein RBR51_10985, partial [Candidatus Cloacimonadaceae bacterium]|nr:hypothetical protein [Candidatus Cloacimonadaceae bacterium]
MMLDDILHSSIINHFKFTVCELFNEVIEKDSLKTAVIDLHAAMLLYHLIGGDSHLLHNDRIDPFIGKPLYHSLSTLCRIGFDLYFSLLYESK